MIKHIKNILEVVILGIKVTVLGSMVYGGYLLYYKIVKDDKIQSYPSIVIVEGVIISADENFQNNKSIIQKIKENWFSKPVQIVRVERKGSINIVVDSKAPSTDVNKRIKEELCGYYTLRETLSKEERERKALKVVVSFFCEGIKLPE